MYLSHPTIKFIFWGYLHDESCFANAYSEDGREFKTVNAGLKWASKKTQLTISQIRRDQYSSDVLIFSFSDVGAIFADLFPHLQSLVDPQTYGFDQINDLETIDGHIFIDLD
jgi:hypothetical protein